MLDQNTDRMWYVIGAIIIGGLILTSSIVLFTDVAFASVQDAFSMFSNVAEVNEIPDYYVLATDDDFEWVPYTGEGSYRNQFDDGLGHYRYIGDGGYIIIPDEINGVELDNYTRLFSKHTSGLKGVAKNNKKVTNMSYMFYGISSNKLDLEYLDVSLVERMGGMFELAQIDELDIGSWNTSNVTYMGVMFYKSHINILNVKGFDTRSVLNMNRMFKDAHIGILDLSSFTLFDGEDANDMFYNLWTDEVIVKDSKYYELIRDSEYLGLSEDVVMSIN